MSPTLPELIDPWHAADANAELAGSLVPAELPRLAALIIERAGDVIDYRVAFSRDDERRAVVHVEARAALALCCQRCLEAVVYEIHADSRLAAVSGLDEANRLPDYYEPLVADERLIRTRELVEDELLLGLPQIPRHDPGLCRAASLEDVAEVSEVNPFGILAALKDRE